MPATQLRLLGPWRASLQWLLLVCWLTLPLLRPGGIGLLRVDLSALTLEFAGRRLPVEDFYLLLLLALALVLLFLFLTLALGRVWCGWLCPQTALVDLYEALARRLGLRISAGRIVGSRSSRWLLHLLGLGIALLLAYSLVAYFLPPAELLHRTLSGRLGWPAGVTIATVAVLVYADLVLLRRLFCRELCPYGRLQAALIDAGTLTLRFHPHEAARCIRCGACVRACPVGIDIRAGSQIECINCGRCLDACRQVMHRRNEPGIIRYTFGLSERGAHALLNPRFLLVGAALLAAIGCFAAALIFHPSASLKFGRSAAPARRLDSGGSAVFYQALVQNRSPESIHVTLSGQLLTDATPLNLHGPTGNLELAPGERRKLDFAITIPEDLRPGAPFRLQLTDATGRIVASADGILPDLRENQVFPEK